MRMQGYCDVYKWTILKRTSPEVKCLHPTSSRFEMCTSSVSNVIYHKFSHGAAFYTLNGKNVNVMLECSIDVDPTYLCCIDVHTMSLRRNLFAGISHNSKGIWDKVPCCYQIISEMLHLFHKQEKFHFLKRIIQS